MTERECKTELRKIIARVVIDDAEKQRILEKISDEEGVFPFKSIAHDMVYVDMLPMTESERAVLDEIKFVYI